VTNAADDRTRAAVTAAARQSYGRLLSWLAWQWRDIAAAEDALADAFAAALERWPRDGVPASPEGWLMTVAKRNLLQGARRQRRGRDPALTVLLPSASDEADTPGALPDDRLRLMFVCAHPAIDPTMRSALMLQTVLGLDAARIASAFLLSTEAMTKRLVRVKAKIRMAGIRFEEPQLDEWPERVDAVLDAIYGCYTLHWGAPYDPQSTSLADEALFLAELVAAQLPAVAETLGLLALLLLCEARRPARIDTAGEFVPLDQQSPDSWDATLIERANSLIAHAAAQRNPGPFQIEAAIQAAHCHRLYTGSTPWGDIALLYERLLAMHPSIGARIGHAVAVAQSTGNADAGLQLLDGIEAKGVESHQPWWAARSYLLAGVAARGEEAADACSRALALTSDPTLQRHLARRLAALRGLLH
jgi:RNA polymerase sigma-70 factor (ECF subfamily)